MVTPAKFVQLLVVAPSKLEVRWNDLGFLVVASSVSRRLQDLSAEVF